MAHPVEGNQLSILLVSAGQWFSDPVAQVFEGLCEDVGVEFCAITIMISIDFVETTAGVSGVCLSETYPFGGHMVAFLGWLLTSETYPEGSLIVWARLVAPPGLWRPSHLQNENMLAVLRISCL